MDDFAELFNILEDAGMMPDVSVPKRDVYVPAYGHPPQEQGLDYQQAQMETEMQTRHGVQLTKDMLPYDQNFVNAARNVYKHFEGKPKTIDTFPPSQMQQAIERSDKEMTDYAVDLMGEFFFNFAGTPVTGSEGMLYQAASIIGAGDAKKAQDFLYLMDQYERLPAFGEGAFSRMFKGILQDPANWAAAATLGGSKLVTAGGQQATKVGIRSQLKQLAARSLTDAATELAEKPAMYAGLGEATRGAMEERALIGTERTAGYEVSGLEEDLRVGLTSLISGLMGAGMVKGGEALVGNVDAPEVQELISRTASDIVAGAERRTLEREGSVQLGAGIDPVAAVDNIILGAQKLAGKTDEPQPLDVNPEVVQLTPEEKSGSIIPQLYEGEEIAPPEAGKRTIFDVANEIDLRTQKSGATAAVTPANKTRIAKLMAAETLHAMRKAGNAGDWYRTKVDNAMAIAQRVYPEAMQDPNKMQSLKFITAITSNGASVQDNAERTFQIFDDFLVTNRMPEKLEFGGGKERPAMEFAFKLYNDMVDEMGETEFFDFISQEFTVRELDEIGKKYGFKVSGENKDTVLPASVIFGPKIGGGFYQNLNGNYKPLTMDRWFMRSWGRYTGSLVVKQSEKTARQQLDRIRSEVTPEIAAEYGYSHNELLADDDLLIELAQRAHKDYVKSGYKNKTELNKASKNFVEAQKKVLEAPGGGNQRNFMREAVDEALEILKQQGIELDRAALQALIWYPEKELYAKFGVGSKRSAPTDYETEFAKIANSRGVDVSDITGNANTE